MSPVNAFMKLSTPKTKEQTMASKAKQPVKRKAIAKKAARRKVAKKQSAGLKSAKKTARAVVKSASKKTIAAKKAGQGFVRRAIKAVTGAVAPLLPGSTPDKSENT
jgi:hypothetical protein